MNKLKKLFIILPILTCLGCYTTLTLNKQFYNNKSVGVIIQIDSINMIKSGSQGLLDMALTPGTRFHEPLKAVEPQLNIIDTFKFEISNILKDKNKNFKFINVDENYLKMIDFDTTNSDKKYSKKDFRIYKNKYTVDEILHFKIKYGLLVSYYGAIETGKQGYINIESEIIDLTDNSLLQKAQNQTVANINGHWKEGENFKNLKNAVQEAINTSFVKLKVIFN